MNRETELQLIQRYSQLHSEKTTTLPESESVMDMQRYRYQSALILETLFSYLFHYGEQDEN